MKHKQSVEASPPKKKLEIKICKLNIWFEMQFKQNI